MNCFKYLLVLNMLLDTNTFGYVNIYLKGYMCIKKIVLINN